MSTNPTPPPSHEAITARARALWEAAGRPEGSDERIWLQAERELKAQAGPETPSTAGQDPRSQSPKGLKKRGR
jgi:hypothetical protein